MGDRIHLADKSDPTALSPTTGTRLRRIRIAVQLICLALFLWLFRITEYTGADTIPWSVNLWFRLDPLVAASVTLATRTVVTLLWPALIVIAVTWVLGRVFCGWVCPLGTLIDLWDRVVRPGKLRAASFRSLKYAILTLVLVASMFTMQLTGFFDPFALLVRGMTFSVDPGIHFLVTGMFDWIYLNGPVWLSSFTEPVYDFLKAVILPYTQQLFFLSLLSFLLLAAVFLLELAGPRFWCRNLCPLGALLALVAKVSPFKRIPQKVCSDCDLCRSACLMDAVDSQGRVRTEECTLCLDCLAFCPRDITTFRFTGPRFAPGMDIRRRQLLAAGLAGAALPVLTWTNAMSNLPNHRVIRPPGALPETDFLAACVRCGACMKVCLNNALQPLFLEQGVAQMFTPVLVPRLGYCEFNCTLCIQVCPTSALQPMDLAEKQAFVMGMARFDKNRCIPYADQTPCLVCEEHCPVHDKAIQLETVEIQDRTGQAVQLKLPYVVTQRCIGCGICEHVCPVQGPAGVRVESRSPVMDESYYSY